MTDSAILQAIRNRRSIRKFTDDTVPRHLLERIIEAGIWAPSGLNNQPWRFVIVTDHGRRQQLAQQTRYHHIVAHAPALIAVYLDREAMYDHTKDCQAAGACIQNMLLATEALGLGAVWLGQILNNRAAVNEILSLSDRFLLMAVLAIGYPVDHDQHSSRKPLDHFILHTYEEELR